MMGDHLDNKYKSIAKIADKYKEEIILKEKDIEKLKFEKDCIENCFIQFIQKLPKTISNKTFDGANDYIDGDKNKFDEYYMLTNALNFYFGFPFEIDIKQIITYGKDNYAHEIHFDINDKEYYIFIPNTAIADEENYIYMKYGKFEFGIHHNDEKRTIEHESIISSYDPLDINNALKHVLEVKND